MHPSELSEKAKDKEDPSKESIEVDVRSFDLKTTDTQGKVIEFSSVEKTFTRDSLTLKLKRREQPRDHSKSASDGFYCVPKLRPKDEPALQLDVQRPQDDQRDVQRYCPQYALSPLLLSPPILETLIGLLIEWLGDDRWIPFQKP